MMNEARRQAYLQAMGIDAYIARGPMPGAAPSRFRPPRVSPPAEHQAPPSPLTETPLSGFAAATSSGAPLRGEAAPPGVETQGVERRKTASDTRGGPAVMPRPEPRPEAPPAGKTGGQEGPAGDVPAPVGEAVRFHLAFLRCGELAVVNELPWLGRDGLGPLQRQLLAALLKARGWEAGLEGGNDSFRWPFSEALPMDAEAARASLRAYLDQQAARRPFRLLLVMGERLRPFVAGEERREDASASLGQDGTFPDSPWPLLLTRSIDEMLSLPALKRQAWRDLAPLRPGSDTSPT